MSHTCRRWTEAEDALLRAAIAAVPRQPLASVAEQIGRTTEACFVRARVIGASKAGSRGRPVGVVPHRQRWTPAEDERLLALLSEKGYAHAAERLNRTEACCRQRASVLPLPRAHRALSAQLQ
jgi:hypothetical protein